MSGGYVLKLRALLGLALAAGIMAPSTAWGQERQVTGTVVRANNAQPISDAAVSVVGSLVSVRTDAEGRFRIQVPAGSARLLVRAIGFTRQEVALASGQASVDVRLEEDVFKLDEVIVTGQATQV